MKNLRAIVAAFAFLIMIIVPAKGVNLLPTPVSCRETKGVFPIGTVLTYEAPDSVAGRIERVMSRMFSPLKIQRIARNADLRIEMDDKLADGYNLSVGKKGIKLAAGTYAGVVNGVATLRQLLPADLTEQTNGGAKIPGVEIKDRPAHGWRGLMLDCARHFFTVDELHRVLDLMALYKLNTFHWHLVDDQGWRAEILRYPELTQKGAWRKYDGIDRRCLELAARDNNPDMLLPADRLRVTEQGDTLYGGYYTQQEMRDMVKYAADRGITIVPEIDVPGHSRTLTAVMPELSCEGRSSASVCPGNDSTLTVIQNIFSELFDIFPSKYVHIGGDEVDKRVWRQCHRCKARAVAENLPSTDRLQAWFIRQMESYFKANGRTLIGWDEIIADGLGEGNAIMWWRGDHTDVIPKATAAGMSTVCTDFDCLYLNFDNNDRFVDKILNLSDRLGRLAPQERRALLGVQANLWSEYVPTFRSACHQIFPRLFAVAEVAWTDPTAPQRLTRKEFDTRADAHYALLDAMGATYALPEITGVESENIFVGKTEVAPKMRGNHGTLRYTLDGTIPDPSSPLFTEPIEVTDTLSMTFASFRPENTRSEIRHARYIPVAGYSPATEAANEPGLRLYRYRNGEIGCVADIDRQLCVGDTVVAQPCMPGYAEDRCYIWRGYIDVPADGIYTFTLSSDAGSTLDIDGKRVVNNDWVHVTQRRRGQAALARGLHPVEIRYFVWRDASGSFDFEVNPPVSFRH